MTKKAEQEAAKARIQSLIATNDRAVARAVVAIYRRQTPSEQACHATHVDNGMGFTGPDALFLSSLAEWVLKDRPLTQRQTAAARPKLMKYWKQLSEVAAEKAALKSHQPQEMTQ